MAIAERIPFLPTIEKTTQTLILKKIPNFPSKSVLRMQKSYTLLVSCLLLAVAQSFSQVCSTCSIDYAWISPGVYPDTLPPATAGEFYESDITFVMQDDTTVDVVGTLEFLNYHILEPVGMPYGMNVSTNLGDLPVDYDPDVSLYGCARVCGTPLVPGWYEVTVPLIATLEYPGGDQAAEYSIFLEVLPAVPEDGGIIPSLTYGCDPINVDFETSIHSDGIDGFTYSWDFGNGVTSTAEFPPTQTYTAVGGVPTDYVVSHTITIDTFGYQLEYATIVSSGCDDCTFFGCTGLIETEKPDLYLIIDALGINTEDEAFIDTSPPVTITLGAALDPGATYTMQMKDDDGGLAGGDDNCGSFTFGGDDVGISTLTAGSHTVEISITHPVISYTFYDTITVYPAVTTPEITLSGATTFCSGDSLVLSTTEVDGINYQWSMDGDPIPGAYSTSLVVFASGGYALSATGVGGCFAESSATAVTVYEQPTPPSIIVIGNTLNTTSTWDVQWYYNGSPIPSATSTTYTPAVEGLYQVAAINGPCIAYSVEINFIFQSVNDLLIDKITISPNPNNGAFSATFNVLKNQNISITVQNILGSTIYQKNYENVSGSMQENILLQGVNSGVYFLQIKGETGSIIEKIIIQ